MSGFGSEQAAAIGRFQLKEGERIDYVGDPPRLGIIQSGEVFSFSLDAILLGQFVTVRHQDQVVDLGTGDGILPLLLMSRQKAPKKVVGVEIQPRLADMARRSIAGNGLGDRIQIGELDLKEASKQFGTEQFDVVVSNPPYRPAEIGDTSLNDHLRIAKHEVLCTWEDVVDSASKLVKFGGKVAFVHRADRLVDILHEMRSRKLEPKRLRLVHPYPDREPNMVLVEGIKHGGRELRILPPLIVHERNGEYTEEMKELFNRS